MIFVQQRGRAHAAVLLKRIGGVANTVDQLGGAGEHLAQQRIGGIAAPHAPREAAWHAQAKLRGGGSGAEGELWIELEQPAQLERIASLGRFFELINELATRLLSLEPDELGALLRLFGPDTAEEPQLPL